MGSGALGLAACDRPNVEPAGFGTQSPLVHVVWTFPPNEARGVSVRESIRVQFDRFLLPYTAVRQSFCVQSASIGPPGAALKRCLGAAFEPIYDPVDRVVVLKPKTPLLANTRYNVVIQSPLRRSFGIRAFDNAPLEDDYTFAFWTGDESQAAKPFRPSVDFCPESSDSCAGAASAAADADAAGAASAAAHAGADAVGADAADADAAGNDADADAAISRMIAVDETSPLAVLRACSAGATCHGPGPMQGRPPHGGVLRLRTPGDSTDSALGVATAMRALISGAWVATETATAPDPMSVQRSTDTTFGQNMPYIDPSNAGNSFLLYKLIIGLREQARTSTAPPPSTCTHATQDATAPSPSAAIPDDASHHDSSPMGSLSPTALEPWVPDDSWRPAAPGEYQRLRQVIRGEPMPYLGETPWWWAETIGAWIASGARLDSCPPPR